MQKTLKIWLLVLLIGTGGLSGTGIAQSINDYSELPTDGWITNGGNVLNQRYSPLDQVNTNNVAKLKANWQVHLNGSGDKPPFSGEAQPIVSAGVIYISTGADDVFAIDVATGKKLWVYEAHLDKTLTDVCCGWTSRGVALGAGKIYLGRLDGLLVALDQRTGKEIWSVTAERRQDGLTITSAPLFYDGMVIVGAAGGDLAGRGRVRAFNARSGKLIWTFYTVPGPGEFGHDTWPSQNNLWKFGGGMVWQTPAVDPKHGLLYFSTGNPGPDFNGSQRAGDNLFTASIVALDVKTGAYRWHRQLVHHDLWDYDAASPVVLFDMPYQGVPREAIAEFAKTGWVYVLDRLTGEPLIGIEEKNVPQEPRQKTSLTQPFPVGDAVVPHSIDIPPAGFQLVNEGGIFTPYWDKPVISKPSPWGGGNWPPSSYDPQQGLLFVCGNDQPGRFQVKAVSDPVPGTDYTQGVFGFAEIPINGIFAAVDVRTNKVSWSQRWKDSCYSGSTATAGGLVFTGRNDGQFVAMNSHTGEILWTFQTGAGVNATASVFEFQGQQYVVVLSAGNMFAGSPGGDSLWLFSLNGTVGPADPARLISDNSSAIDLTGADAEAGSQVFSHYCSACHGEDGKGGHGGGPDITARIKAQLVMNTVVAGKNKMPSFAPVLTYAQIRDVSQYVSGSFGK